MDVNLKMDDTKYMKNFGKKLRLLRHKRGLTLRELSEMLGVHNSHVARIEQGLKPSTNLIIKISHIFDVSIDVLMKDELEL